MKNLFAPHIEALSAILSKVRYQKDKGNYFYKNGARNVLFRLEALCRIGKSIHDKKFFSRWGKEFKKLEDILGEIDHQDAMASEFGAMPLLANQVRSGIEKDLVLRTTELSRILVDDGWMSGEKLDKFTAGLKKQDEVDPKKFRMRVAEFLLDTMAAIEEDYDDGKIDLTHLEAGLHEFRREIRWISIYALVLDGLIQLRPVAVVDSAMKLYTPKNIVESPFNVMPKPHEAYPPLYIQSTSWYALSWLIQHLGDLKDIGLRYHTFMDLSGGAKYKQRTDRASLTKKFLATCDVPPAELSPRAEMAIDHFLYRDWIFNRIARDLRRGLKT